MTDKNCVEELLAELFTDEASNSAEAVNSEENYPKNSIKTIQFVLSDNTFDNDVVSILTSNDPTNVKEITDNDFQKLFRMQKSTFYDLQKEISEKNEDTNLLTCLWILGNTAPLNEASLILGITEKQILAICEHYVKKIIKLSSRYISWPTPCEMLTIENTFKSEYEFPSIIGAIGCLHIAVHLSEDNQNCSDYFNMSTSNYTIVLQVVCDSNLLFRDIFVGFPGNNSVENILRASPLNERLMDENSYLRKSNKHLLGGTEHPQIESVLTPYPIADNQKLSVNQLKFNSMHNAAMLVVDKTFHIVENRFQRMKCLDCVNVEFATLTIAAICILHNFTRIRNDNYCS